MGNKITPTAFRTGINLPWVHNWCIKNYDKYVNLLISIDGIMKKYRSHFDDYTISALDDKLILYILSNRKYLTKPAQEKNVKYKKPSIMDIHKDLTGSLDENMNIQIRLKEHVRNPLLYASHVSNLIEEKIKMKLPYRNVISGVLNKVKEIGVRGCKIKIKGRLNGNTIANKDIFSFGRVPTNHIKSIIDYKQTHISMSYGIIGLKVWIFVGESEEEDFKKI